MAEKTFGLRSFKNSLQSTFALQFHFKRGRYTSEAIKLIPVPVYIHCVLSNWAVTRLSCFLGTCIWVGKMSDFKHYRRNNPAAKRSLTLILFTNKKVRVITNMWIPHTRIWLVRLYRNTQIGVVSLSVKISKGRLYICVEIKPRTIHVCSSQANIDIGVTWKKYTGNETLIYANLNCFMRKKPSF